MAELTHLSATIHGKVQGVYYRAFTARLAKSLAIKGYVKNIRNTGDVEMEAEGERTKLEEMLRQLHIGPPEALVEKIDTRWSNYTGQYVAFEVRY